MNQSVKISSRDSGIFIEPIKIEKTSLTELLSKITEGNTHDLIDFGAPIGKEVW